MLDYGLDEFEKLNDYSRVQNNIGSGGANTQKY